MCALRAAANCSSIPIRGITLFIFGDVTKMSGEPPHPLSELLLVPVGRLAISVLDIALGVLVFLSGVYGFGAVRVALSEQSLAKGS